jgi:hypothetical protein
MIVRFLLGLALFSCTAHAWSQGCTAIQVGDPCLPPEMVYPHMNDPAPARPPAPVRPTKPLFGAIAKDNLNRLSWVLNDYVWSAAGLQGKSFGREDKSAAMYSAFGWRYLSWP